MDLRQTQNQQKFFQSIWETRLFYPGLLAGEKKDPPQSLQMIQRPLITPDEFKTLKKGHFIVTKTGMNPMKMILKLFLKWGITFEGPYEMEEKSARKVSYVDKARLEDEIVNRQMAYKVDIDEEKEDQSFFEVERATPLSRKEHVRRLPVRVD